MTNTDPPAYDIEHGHDSGLPHGFPNGYFVIKNCATGRLLDISSSSSTDGARAVLWTPKENSLVLQLRNPAADNQVFFVDYTGALCSKASGHAIDVEGGSLVLRHRKPFTPPFPNSHSHPLPRITYSSTTKILRATFGCDPNYPGPNNADPTYAWRSIDYVIAGVPLQRPRSFLQNTFAIISTIGATLSKPQALLTNVPTSPTAVGFGNDGSAADFALRDDEVMEEDRLGGEEDVDDSIELGRPVRVLELPVGWLEKAGVKLSDEALRRRQWDIVPLTNHRRRASEF